MKIQIILILLLKIPIKPMIISIVKPTLDSDVYISLIREVEENSRLTTPISAIEIPWWRSALGIQPSPFDIARSILKFHKKDYPYSKLVQIKNPKFPEALLRLEEKQTLKGYKFGVLVSMKGQRKEQEMFSNVDQSEGFTEFLKFLGKKVKLLNWSNFKGGLDTKSETTGKYSIYRKWNENEIMFHVSTMLPYSAKDDQQLERKRHIGNDSVVILFLDDDETIYVPTSISSRQIHVIIVIKKVVIDGETCYQMGVCSKEEVPNFGPTIPEKVVFRKDKKI